ncbi:MAG TPA: VUT family protein, partial [Spirochaetia bacterium]|nr:VUT family protein [Spirochaetia bacterium]
VFKVGVEALFTPLTYRIIAWLKRTEGEDYYDYETKFTPL